MNPGYDRLDYQGSTRAIHYECMSCHNAYPRIPASQRESGSGGAIYVRRFRRASIASGAMDPERATLPWPAQAAPTRGEIRAAIVNPARLSPDREMEVCLQCHLETTSRLLPHAIPRLGRGPFDYVPGQPLGDFRLDFDRAPGKNEDFEVAHAAYRLRASQCFLKSAGKLRCTSCHNPHDIPRGEAAARHYNAVCQGCHAAPQAPGHQAQADCIGCHMPKRRTDDAVHIVMTDHKIVRHKPAGDLLAAKAGETRYACEFVSRRSHAVLSGNYSRRHRKPKCTWRWRRSRSAATCKAGLRQLADVDREVSSVARRVFIPVWRRATGRREIW